MLCMIPCVNLLDGLGESYFCVYVYLCKQRCAVFTLVYVI